MKLRRVVTVFDAADVAAESTFWAGLLGGFVVDDDPNFHCVIDADGAWRIGVQHAPEHRPPQWPDGSPQQVHLDLHADEFDTMHDRAIELGARVLQSGDRTAGEGHQVYADPAGHPFCIGWGQPDDGQLARFLAQWRS